MARRLQFNLRGKVSPCPVSIPYHGEAGAVKAKSAACLYGSGSPWQLSKRHIDPVAKEDHKLHQDAAPVFDGHRPFIRDLHGHKIQLLEQGVVAYERTLGFRDLAQLTVEVLDSVGRVDDSPDLFRILEHGGKLVPMIPPGFDRCRILASPGGFQLVQSLQCKLLGGRLVNGLERCGKGFDVFIRYIAGRAADLMDDAPLDFCPGICRGNGFRKAGQSIY